MDNFKASPQSAALYPRIILGACVAVAIGAFAWFSRDPENEAVEVAIDSRTAKILEPVSSLIEKPEKGVTSILSPNIRINEKQEPTERESVQAEVAEMVAQQGEAKTAEYYGWKYKGGEANQRLAMESLALSWAEKDNVGAANWIIANTGEDGQLDGMLRRDLLESVVSGYIEGVADGDAETAAKLADFLELQTEVPGTPEISETSGIETPTKVVVDKEFPGDPGFPGDPYFLVPK
jgi:hypothetical protein